MDIRLVVSCLCIVLMCGLLVVSGVGCGCMLVWCMISVDSVLSIVVLVVSGL